MDNYQIEDVVAVIEGLLQEVDPERREVLKEELNVEDILNILKGNEEQHDAAEEEGTQAEVESAAHDSTDEVPA